MLYMTGSQTGGVLVVEHNAAPPHCDSPPPGSLRRAPVAIGDSCSCGDPGVPLCSDSTGLQGHAADGPGSSCQVPPYSV